MDRPHEILLWLEREHGAYELFLAGYDGVLVIAAHALASIKRQATTGDTVPTLTEVHVAAREIAHRTTLFFDFVPTRETLSPLVDLYGLNVI